MENQESTKANVVKRKEISAVWIIPGIAILIGAWMFYQYLNSRGPEITLILKDASGIQVGKTEIKSRNVSVGKIIDVGLSENYDFIIAKAKMSKDSERMLREDSLFWVVKPHIGTDGVSGLETLLSGSYIELKPGISSDDKKLKFEVLDLPPIAGPDAQGKRVTLWHPQANMLSVGEPVFHHGFTVGRVEKASFDFDNKRAMYQLFIFSPYDGLVFERSQFWLQSGIDIKLDSEGFDVQIGSLESILAGGVSFDVTGNIDPGNPITDSTAEFKLYDNYIAVSESKYSEYVHYVFLFDESVRGLATGAPIEYRGIRIGTVETVPININVKESGVLSNRIPVLARFESERFSEILREVSLDEFEQNLNFQISQGLRGTLKTGNLLTGALYIDIDFYDDFEPVEAQTYSGYSIFPVVSGGLAEIQNELTSFLKKINQLPLQDTVVTLNGTLMAATRTLNKAEQVTQNINAILSNNKSQNIPDEINETLLQLQLTLESFDERSSLYNQLQRTTSELEKTLHEMQPLLKNVKEKPNSLLFGNDDRSDPTPRKGNNK